ncbi:hypothetical protein HZA33_00670 [Candidatus Pacearchaeota archaeon]|nr:hypothetical protein [Candidatus Pacearchaeota archaeon]
MRINTYSVAGIDPRTLDLAPFFLAEDARRAQEEARMAREDEAFNIILAASFKDFPPKKIEFRITDGTDSLQAPLYTPEEIGTISKMIDRYMDQLNKQKKAWQEIILK